MALFMMYSQRQLTYSHDTLNAIAGILSKITKQTGNPSTVVFLFRILGSCGARDVNQKPFAKEVTPCGLGWTGKEGYHTQDENSSRSHFL